MAEVLTASVISANLSPFLLRYGREDRDHQLPGCFQRVHGFLLKDDGDVQGFELPDVVQSRISLSLFFSFRQQMKTIINRAKRKHL